MAEETFIPYKVHQGLNIKRIRTAERMKQDTFARLLNVSQQTVSKYESLEILDDEFINKSAKALNVPVELIKNTPEDLNSQSQMIVNTKATSNKSATFGFNTPVTNYFCDEELISMIKENLAYIKHENKELRNENEELRKEIELLNSKNREME